jgi:uncharacterized protein YgbK (DUF1537 family)
VILGCIGDDFTGSSDLANTLAKEGMRVTQYVGVPDGAAAPEVEAGVVALKSRSNDPREAVAQSLAALDWLRAQGCTQVFFKYCSTFDSTAEGNIGPVAQALADALDARGVVFCPAFPGTGRSIYQGHLFVADALLSESGMQNHPLTPMTDPDLRRVLAAQCSESVGHVGYADVAQGASAISAALAREDAAGHRFVIMDALQDSDLREIGAALDGAALITGGSGVALGLPANFRKAGLIGEAGSAWQGQTGPCVILSGSCSIATRGQLEVHRADSPSMEISAEQILSGDVTAQSATAWAVSQEGIPVIYSSADPDVVRQVQDTHGREASADAIEAFFAATARALVAAGVTRLITAGGETSGAVVEGLSLGELAIGPEIDPGVPALRAGEDLVLALKSGNFGAPDFFAKAAGILEGRG